MKNTFRLIQKNWKRLFMLELIYKSIFFFLIVPFISFGFNIALKFTKYSYITTENILRFVSYPQTIVVIVLNVIVIALYIQMETASLLFFFEDSKNKKKHNIAQLLIAGIRSMFSLLKRKCYLVPVYTMFMSIFFNIPLIFLVITETGIPSYLMKSLLSMDYVKVIVSVVLVVLLSLCYRRIYVLPLCILDKKAYKEAKKISITYTKEYHNTLIVQLISVNLVLALMYMFIYAVCFGLLVLGINLFVDRNVAIPLFLHNFEQLNRIIFSCASIIGVVVNYASISNLYVRASKPRIKELEVIVDKSEKAPKEQLRSSLRKQMKNVVIVLCGLCALTAYSYFYNILQNGSFRAEKSILGLQITAHRGNSIMAPENTLPALQSAIDCLADYAEIDVQLTKDGEVILCHDSNLYRTAGVKVKLSKLNYDELLGYDVGAWFSDEYLGTPVPTLAQVLELSKGKINLNIEMKRMNKQEELAQKVVALIEEYEFERQCVVSSMSYEAIEIVKEINPEIRTGYIMSIAYGNFYENENIDFFSMKASVVTEEIVKKAHTLGKEVHVWTVNSRNEITRLAALGVDNIITDKPVYVQEVLYDVERTSLLQYVKMIIK